MRETLIAYMAGVVDGEGCLTIAKQIRKDRMSPTYRATVTVTNTDRRMVDIFADNFGGWVAKRSDKRKSKNWADSYTWYCPCSRVVSFLTYIYPYLIIKSRQAILLMKFQAKKSSFKRKSLGQGKGSAPLSVKEIAYKEKLYCQIKELNTKGVFSRNLKFKNQ